MIVLLGLGYSSYRSNVSSLQDLNEENIAWTSSRLEAEYHLFLRSLAALSMDTNGATARQVNRRFDILWSRLALTERGTVGERLRAFDSRNELARLFDHLKREEQAVVNINAADKIEIKRLFESFASHQPRIDEFARTVFFGEGNRIANARAELRKNAVFIASVNILALLLGGLLLFIVDRANRINARMSQEHLELAEAARNANRAKSRFLTMMSHELRTPMNGVLGMLSLTRNAGLSVPQTRLIDQAERSGQQMIAMLSDILDYSALQDEEILIEEKPFDPRQLTHAIEELFASAAQREGIKFIVACKPDCPTAVIGDFKRLRQVVAHFASYIVETANTDNVAITVSHAAETLEVRIAFSTTDLQKAGADDWLVHLLMGTRDHDENPNKNSGQDDPSDPDQLTDQFATDALGPRVSRELLKKMGGSMALDHADNEICLVVKAPAPLHSQDVINIHVIAASNSLRTIFKLALAQNNFCVVDDPTQVEIHRIMFEAGGQDELKRLQDVRRGFPNAIIVAVGRPTHPQEFDDVMQLPLDVDYLHSTINRTGRRQKLA